MDAQSSLRKQADFNQRILCGSRRSLRSLMPNENPGHVNKLVFLKLINLIVIYPGIEPYMF